MAGHVAQFAATVGRPGNHPAAVQHHRADRHLTRERRPGRQLQCLAHRQPLGVGRDRLPRLPGRALGPERAAYRFGKAHPLHRASSRCPVVGQQPQAVPPLARHFQVTQQVAQLASTRRTPDTVTVLAVAQRPVGRNLEVGARKRGRTLRNEAPCRDRQRRGSRQGQVQGTGLLQRGRHRFQMHAVNVAAREFEAGASAQHRQRHPAERRVPGERLGLLGECVVVLRLEPGEAAQRLLESWVPRPQQRQRLASQPVAREAQVGVAGVLAPRLAEQLQVSQHLGAADPQPGTLHVTAPGRHAGQGRLAAQELPQHRLGLVAAGVRGQDRLELRLPGHPRQEAVAQPAGGVLEVPAALLGHRRHVQPLGDEGQAESGGEVGHEGGVTGRVRAQRVVEVRHARLGPDLVQRARQGHRVGPARYGHQHPAARVDPQRREQLRRNVHPGQCGTAHGRASPGNGVCRLTP